MKLRNYCIVVMGDKTGAMEEIRRLSEIEPSTLDSGGILLATFSCFAEPRELTEYFKMCKKNFFIFDLNEDCSGFNILKKKVEDGLFGFLKEMNKGELQTRTDDLLGVVKEAEYDEEISGITSVTTMSRIVKKELTEKDLNSLTATEKDNLMNALIDKGIKNLSDEDKELLQKLA